MTISHGPCCPILMKFFVKLFRASPSPLTPYLDLSGTNMYCKTPGRDWRKIESLDRVEDISYYLNKLSGRLPKASPSLLTQSQALSGISMFSKPTDQTFWTMSRITLSFKSLSGVLEDMKLPDKDGSYDRGQGELLGRFTKKFIKIGEYYLC